MQWRLKVDKVGLDRTIPTDTLDEGRDSGGALPPAFELNKLGINTVFAGFINIKNKGYKRSLFYQYMLKNWREKPEWMRSERVSKEKSSVSLETIEDKLLERN